MIKYVFGPVPSRRLGISLGVDIIPYKTCTLDCIYCECGKTTNLTTKRQSFMEPAIILEQIKEIVSTEGHIQYITFSGGGEPTLHKDIGQMISGVKKLTHIPVAVLTNATLFYLPQVREELLQADLILPSLDAFSPDVFKAVNLPHPDLQIKQIIDGLIQFRREYHGQMWLEVFIAKEVNDSADELEKIYQTIKKIQPDKVQLNSLDRPPAYDNVQPVAIETLEQIVEKWTDLPVEIIKRIRKREEITAFSRNLENNILNTIKRRALAIDDLEALTGKNRLELFKYIDVLEKEKKIRPQIVGDKIFYMPAS